MRKPGGRNYLAGLRFTPRDRSCAFHFSSPLFNRPSIKIMRKRSTENSPFSVHAIAGTEVVLLAMDAEKDATEGLLGFSIYRREGTSGRYAPLPGGGRTFSGRINAKESSETAPIQAFMWNDYRVDRARLTGIASCRYTGNRAVSSMTGGMGSFTMEFSHYDPMPANIQQEITSKAVLTEEEDS